MLGDFGEVNYLLCASVSSPVKWRNNSVSLSGQGSFWGMQPVTSHMVWHSECSLVLVFNALWSHLNILNKFYFGFPVCTEVRWGLEPWLTGGPFCACLPLLWRGSVLPLVLLPLPPCASSGARAWGPGSRINQWSMCSVSGTGEGPGTCGYICFRPANISWKGQAMEERKKLLSCNYNKGLAFLFCTGPCKLRSCPWIGCLEDWRTNRCTATGTMPDIHRCDRKVCRIITYICSISSTWFTTANFMYYNTFIQ